MCPLCKKPLAAPWVYLGDSQVHWECFYRKEMPCTSTGGESLNEGDSMYKLKLWQILLIVLLAMLITVVSVRSSNLETNPKDRIIHITSPTNCTGTIIQQNRVLTCEHCTRGKVMIGPHTARIVKADKDVDLALLDIPTPPIELIKLASCEASQEVYSWGHPMGERELFFTKGYVMNVSDQYVLSSIITLPGDSGSPLFNQDGALVGIVAGMKSANGSDYPVSVTIPASVIKDFLETTK